jgi:cytoskeletal protein RodZ
MYAWLWRHLPGATLERLGLALAAVVVVGVVLWYLVFPWVEPKLQFDHGTVGGEPSVSSTHSTQSTRATPHAPPSPRP